MGFFERLRSGLRSIGERLGIIERKAPEVKTEIKEIRKEVAKLLEETRPTTQVIRERIDPEPKLRRYRIHLQIRGVSSSRKYPDYYDTTYAESPEEAIAIAETRWTERFGDEIDYILSESAKEIE